MSDFSAKQKALALLPKFPGLLSLAGSSFIFQHIIRDKKRRSTTYHRLLLGMSISDMIGSMVFFLSTWPIPEGTPGVYLASGTTATCSAVGFFNQMAALTTPCYNASLAVYYLMCVHACWPQERIRKVEFWLHSVPISLGLGTAVSGVALTLFNSANWLCWVAPVPAGCDVDDEIECVRGNHSWIFQWAFLYAEVWFIFVFISIAMLCVYFKVYTQERANGQYRFNSDAGTNYKYSRKVANQAMLYVGAFYMTWIFGTLTRLLQLIQGKTYFPLIICMTIFFPLQGFFNALVYMRPRYQTWRKENPGVRLFGMLSPSSFHFSRRSGDMSCSRVMAAGSVLRSSRKSDSANNTSSTDEGPVSAGEQQQITFVEEPIAFVEEQEYQSTAEELASIVEM